MTKIATALTESELTALLSTRTEGEWDDTCDDIKRARDGQYPPDWCDKIIWSGIGYTVSRLWR